MQFSSISIFKMQFSYILISLKALLQRFFPHLFGYSSYFQEKAKTLSKELDELKKTRDEITRLRQLYNAKVKKEELMWALYVEEFEEEAELVTAESKRRFKSLNWPNSQLNKRAEKALAWADKLKEDASSILAKNPFPDRFVKVDEPTTIVGMEKAFEELQRHVTGDEVNIIGIHGMGGTGKTTLLRRLNNHLASTKTDLDMVILIEVSMNFKVEEIQNSIGSRLKLAWQKDTTEKNKAADIYSILSELKSVLLLDNLWEPFKLELVGIPIPEPTSECKVIFTTRMEDICYRMGAEKKIKVECLQDEAARELLKTSASLDPVDANPLIFEQVNLLAKSCGGLPAALITVGKAMAPIKEVEDWQEAVSIMKNAPFLLPGIKRHVLEPLKLSYVYLRNDTLRLCISCLSVYWEGEAESQSSFFCKRNQLSNSSITKFWIGEGIIDEFTNASDAEITTDYLIGELVAASLIERRRAEFFEMHPMVRAMIKWVGREGRKDKIRCVEDCAVTHVEACAAERLISLGGNKTVALPKTPQYPHLLFFNAERRKFIKKMPNGFFNNMPRLRILQLRETAIQELPTGIGKLVHLQHLDLSYTCITSLPRELGGLVSLKYLALSGATCLTNIPDQVISSFQELQWLDMYDSYSGWRVEPSKEGVCFEELESLKRLKVLGITVSTVAALKRLCGSAKLAASLNSLQIKGCAGMTCFGIPSTNYFLSNNMPNLLHIRLHDISELEEVILGCHPEDSTSLSNLETLQLSSLPKAKLVCKRSCLKKLSRLQIEDCNEISQLVEFEGEVRRPGIKTITLFPNLKRIVLRRLPKLTSLSAGKLMLAFPLLTTIKVESCPKLKKLVMVAKKMKVVNCKKSWWKQLDWDDDTTKSFHHLFRLE
ncbi:disease resistance protein RPS2-like [Canna indica]|uniref:Disease resistance protein RPS2-like n=1 Tax=Canna indica TaxID=4628 RepID=A0AAQ3Q9B8_9LILI|nr:disease resistance protein RPS2-like [Canna indica]